MRIWTTTIGQRLDGAENTRTMLLCSELLRRGHEVTLWTSAYDHIRKCWRAEWCASPGGYRTEEGLLVRFMKGCGYSQNVSVRRLVDHRLAARDFIRQARSLPRPDAIVASLPDHVTAAAAVRFGREVDAATIVDVRDKWPDIFIDLAPGIALKSMARTLLAAEIARARSALRGADSIVAMMQSMMDWGLAKAGREQRASDRVFYLTTTPKNFGVDRERHPVPPELSDILAEVEGRMTFAFVGTFNRTQHPSLLLDALDLLRADGGEPSGTAFLIGGDGVDAGEVWERALCFDNVYRLGWLQAGPMMEVLAASDVGLLLMNFPSPAFNNKAFAYLASGLPIINGASGDLAELIDEHDIGINVRAGSAAELASAIRQAASDPAMIETRKQRVRDLFDARFDRESNYADYADHVESFIAGKRPGAQPEH